MFLVVGLGNPGIEYQFTPHNAGFLAVDRIADQNRVAVANRRCRALTAKIQIAGREVILAKPETFMNLSGLSVAALAAEFEIDTARDLLVLYDELDLPLGVIRVENAAARQGTTEHDPSPEHCAPTSGRASGSEWVPTEPEDAFQRGKDYLLTPLRKKDLADTRSRFWIAWRRQ